MLVEFNQRYQVFKAAQRVELGAGIAKELIKRKICKEVKKRGRPKKQKPIRPVGDEHQLHS